MKLSDATNIYVGTSQSTAAYIGTTKVWPKTNVTPGMRMLDGPTFRTYNNINSGASWSTSTEGTWRGDNYDENILVTNRDLYTPASTYLALGSDDYFVIKPSAAIKFKDYTYTKIILKDVTGFDYINTGVGNVVYDSAANEIVWRGNTNELKWSNIGSSDIKFKYIYYDVVETFCIVDCPAFRHLNSLSVGDSLSSATYKLSSNSNIQLTLNQSVGTVSFNNAFRIGSPSSNGYLEISSSVGNMTSIQVHSLQNDSTYYIPSNITADSGTVTIGSSSADMTWTGNASNVKFTWSNKALTINKLTIDYTES